MEKYKKAVASVVMATMIALVPILNSGPITVISKLNIGIAFLSAFLVYLVPNFPEVPMMKTIVASIMAAAMFLVTVVTADCRSLGQLSTCVAVVNWIQCGVVILKAAGVYVIPNEDSGMLEKN